MAYAVPSTASTTWTGAASVVITKPTGLAVGDLMVAVIASIATEVDGFGSWTQRGQSSNSSAGVTLFEKIADAGDVAASNFTFTATGASEMAGAIIRATGNIPAPFDFGDGEEDNNNTPDITQPVFSLSDTPDFNGSLLVMGLMAHGTDGVGTMSSYAINGTNPTWNEVCDFTKDVGSFDPIFGVAYAIQTTAAQITTFYADSSVAKDDWSGVFASYIPIISQSVSPAVLSVSTSVQAPAVSAGAAVSPAVIGATATVQAPVVSTAASKWQNTDKNTSTWTNNDKS